MVCKNLIFTVFLSLVIIEVNAQADSSNAENSLFSNLFKNNAVTPIGGYGELRYTYDFKNKTAEANLDRTVLFVGHKFNNKISFFSELEVEDAKISGGEAGGEVALEQAYLKFNLNRNTWLQAGVFIPRIGIINENHLPTTFKGVNRTFVETLILPSTWREVGVGLYGSLPKLAGLQYSIALVNGLNSAGFESGSGIREGRFEAKNATASNMAITAALLYYKGNFRMQLSGYAGGSAGLTHRVADSLKLESGVFGTPVMLGDFDVQYHNNGWGVKFLASAINIPDAYAINRAYSNNTASLMYGSYAEVAYNILQHSKKYSTKKLNLFARFETLDMNAQIPSNSLPDETLKQQYIIAGATFQPHIGVVVKADYVMKQFGDSFQNKQGFLNLGIGYSF
jgi:hypothetical protein